MRKMFLRAAALFMTFIMLFTSLPLEHVVEASAAKYSFIDYSKIHGSETAKKYDVELSYSYMTLKGSLRYTGSFTDEEINKTIDEVMKYHNIKAKDLIDAQKAVEKWEEKKEISAADYSQILSNLMQMFDVKGAKVLESGNEIFQFLWDNQDNITTIKNLTADIARAKDWEMLSDAFQKCAKFLGKYTWGKNFAASMMELHGKTVAGTAITLGEMSLSRFKVLKILVGTAEVSIDQWMRDKKRWKDRVAAVNGARLLTTFYADVNAFLNSKGPKNQNWYMTAAGSQKRYFNFFGSKNNVQVINLGFGASKNPLPRTTYVSRNDRVNNPFGVYTGTVVIDFYHNLNSFDSNFWNLQIGALPKNWLNDLMGASFGGAIVEKNDSTNIRRKIFASDFSFYVPGGFGEQYSSNIPATIGNRDVRVTIDTSTFTDRTTVDATHKLTYEWGLANEQEGNITAYDYVSLSAHADMTSDSVSITFDDTEAICWIAGMSFVDIDETNVSGGYGWDDNIWKDLDKGIRLKIKFR